MSYTDGITPDYFKTRSIGGIYSDMMRINNPEEAKLYFDNYVQFLDQHQDQHADKTSAEVAQSNLGWCFGEGMTDEKKWMWYRATGANHPIFGMSNPTPEQCFQAGVEMGRKMRHKKQ